MGVATDRPGNLDRRLHRLRGRRGRRDGWRIARATLRLLDRRRRLCHNLLYHLLGLTADLRDGLLSLLCHLRRASPSRGSHDVGRELGVAALMSVTSTGRPAARPGSDTGASHTTAAHTSAHI